MSDITKSGAQKDEWAQIATAAGTPMGTAKGGMFERGEQQQAKFLERPAREERRTILKIIQREARI